MEAQYPKIPWAWKAGGSAVVLQIRFPLRLFFFALQIDSLERNKEISSLPRPVVGYQSSMVRSTRTVVGSTELADQSRERKEIAV